MQEKLYFHYLFQFHIRKHTVILLWAPYCVNEDDDEVIGPDRECGTADYVCLCVCVCVCVCVWRREAL